MEPPRHFSIFPLYERFFTFLERRSGDAWEAFQSHYLSQAPAFFNAYFSAFSYDISALTHRVEVTAPEHYTYLKTLVQRNPPQPIVLKTLKRCRALVPMDHLSVYLIIGFFSADGFTLIADGKPVIGIGLERLRDFSYLDLLTAHEYAHCLRIRNGFASRDRSMSILNEGIASHFCQAVFPERMLPEHLFLSTAAFNQLLEHKDELLSSFLHQPMKKPENGEQELGRTKQFIGYFAINEYRRRRGTIPLNELLALDLTDILDCGTR